MQSTRLSGRTPAGNVSGGVLLNRLVSGPDNFAGVVRRGVIQSVNPGTHGCMVAMDDGTVVSCLPPNNGTGGLFGLGVTGSTLLLPGIPVVILQYGARTGCGVVLCSADHQIYFEKGSKFIPAKSDEGSWMDYGEESAYGLDNNKENNRFCGTGAYKASDTYAGDWMISNEFGVEIFVGRTRATFRGSNMARLDMFPLDDTVRLAAGYFQKYTHSGKEFVFADKGGYVERELLFSPYVWETGGCRKAQDFEQKAKAPDEDIEEQPEALDNPDFARYREYQGAVAGGRQIFTSFPDPDDDINIGLSHIGISDSGALVFRSVSDIIFSRTSKIDIPVRIKTPDDHEGVDQPELPAKDDTPEDEDWWKHDGSRRTVSNIIKGLYRRFVKNDKDWRIDSKAPRDLSGGDPKVRYDENTKSDTDAAGASSQIVLGHDGSIILSTSGGAEIRLHGKDITISCPGKLSFRAGQEVSVISNGDIISKSKGDTEILSKRNALVSAEGRVANFAGNSIFCEVGNSDKESELFPLDKGKLTPGVYLKVAEDKGHIMLDADNMFVHPKRQLHVLAHNEDGEVERNTQMSIAIGQFVVSSNQVAVNTGEKESAEAGLIISDKKAALFGDTVAVAGGSSVPAVCGAGKMPMYIGADCDIYGDLVEQLNPLRSQTMFTEFPLISNIPCFAYKAYLDLTTGEAPSIEESPWVNIKNPSDDKKWGEELEVNKTLPWPGKDGTCKTFRKDYSKLVVTDDGFGDKEEPEEVPEMKVEKFEEYKG